MFGLTVTNANRSFANPFRALDALERSFFTEPFGSFFRAPSLPAFRTDITDKGDCYLVQTDLPGFDKKDIRLELKDNVLTLRAERHAQTEDKDSRPIRTERSYGSYSRSFDITGVDPDGIRARYENGVLSLTLPKLTESDNARTFEIE